MHKLFFEPLDTLFFRDGRPFNQGEGTAGIESLFPPSPLTLVGAARVAWARALGWKGKGKWIDAINTDLGGDDDELVGLNFCGPLLFSHDEPVFPAPALLMGKLSEENKPDKVMHLRPADQVMQCDLGIVRLPVPDVSKSDKVEGRKLLAGWWLTQSGFAKVLQGEIPNVNEFIHQDKLWHTEAKVGNQIDPDTGATVEGMLYSTQHVRLNNGVRLVMGIDGDLVKFPEETQVPLGGEARSCWLYKQPGGLVLSDAKVSDKNGVLRYAVHVLTPLNPEQPPTPDQPFEGLPGKVVSACLPRAQRWGGWDTINWEPFPMKPHLAPGSVIFMQAEKADKQQILDRHGKTIGNRSSWGFGLIAIGQWN